MDWDDQDDGLDGDVNDMNMFTWSIMLLEMNGQ